MAPEKNTPEAIPKMCKGPSGFLMIFLALFTFMVMFNMDIRLKLGEYIGYVLFPVIGFDIDSNGAGDIPVITLLLAGFILATFSTIVRHFQTDWVEMAKNQKQMKTVNKALREAKLGGDTEKERKITEYQQEMMGLQQEMMFNNMKMMIYTMLVAIAIFTWIWADFMEGLVVPVISVPWNPTMNAMERMNVCFGMWVPMYKWLLVYILLSFPMGLMVQHALKFFSFTRRLEKAEEEEKSEMEGVFSALDELIEKLDDETSFSLENIKDKLKEARTLFTKGNITDAKEYARLVKAEIEETGKAFSRTRKRIEEMERNIGRAKKEGMKVKEFIGGMEDAKRSMKKGFFKEAVAKAQEMSDSLKRERKSYRSILKESKDVKSLLYDVRKISPDTLDSEFERMQTSIKRGDYAKAMKQSRELKKSVKNLKEANRKHGKQVKRQNRLLAEAEELGVDTGEARKDLEKAETLYIGRDIEGSNKVYSAAYAGLKETMAEIKDLSEAFSHSKLVISNARERGVDVSSPEARFEDARKAMERGEPDRAKELLAVASREAERLKAQVSRKKRRR